MHPSTYALVWRLPLLLVLLSPSKAFAFTSPTLGRAHARTAVPDSGSRQVTSARPLVPGRAGGGRRTWASNAKVGGNNEAKDDKIDVLTGTGLRGVDTNKLTGSDKRDADWFQRTAEREAGGGLQLFEDPAFYVGLSLLVPVIILVWGVFTCYIPGFCPSTF